MTTALALALQPTLMLSLLSPLPVRWRSSATPRTVVMLDDADIPDAFKPKPKPPELNIVDREGDAMRFLQRREGLSLFVGGELFSGGLDTVTYTVSDGTVAVEDEEVEGAFQLTEEKQTIEATRLYAFCKQSGVEWLGDDPITLPSEVETLLINDELRKSRPGVCLLWAQLLSVYPTEAAAKEAVVRNSAIVLPYLNRPFHIDGSWEVLKTMMSEEEALEVITKNPGILACIPAALKTSNKLAVLTTARAVDTVDNLWPEGLKWPGS